MEHLHPDDAFEQLQNVYNALANGGAYICITPNKLTGPHDISKYFDTEATGFHLKEYTITELRSLFKKIGFSKVKLLAKAPKRYITIPLFFSLVSERLISLMPNTLAKLISGKLPLRIFLNIRLVGIK